MKTNHLYAGWLALLVLLTSSLGGLAETLYVSAQYYGPGPRNDTIQKFTTNGFQSVYANFGSGGPSGLAVDKAGNLYVALENAGTIEKITREGVQTTFATNLSVPVGLALDAAGNLYVANLGINASYSSDRMPALLRRLPARASRPPSRRTFLFRSAWPSTRRAIFTLQT